LPESFKRAHPAHLGLSAKKAGRPAERLHQTVLDGLAQAYKTPLTAILAASAGLSEMGGLSPIQAELVALIDDQACRLSDLTTRLLATARLDAKEAEIHPRPVGVEPIIDDAVAALRPRLANRKVVIDLEDENLALCCDRELILMMLKQYIDNAGKYSHGGTAITIRVALSDSDVIFSVHNRGPVIPVADREFLFDHYSLLSSFAGRTACNGFGLSVAKRIALVHGGNVWVTSDEAQGTTFFAAIPASIQMRCSL